LLSETKGIVKNGDSFFVQEGKKALKVEPSWLCLQDTSIQKQQHSCWCFLMHLVTSDHPELWEKWGDFLYITHS
jgi:hypothetical protein